MRLPCGHLLIGATFAQLAINLLLSIQTTIEQYQQQQQSTIKFMTSLRDRFPLSSRQILVAGLPWVLTPVFKIVMSLIPASHAAAFKLINMDELTQYIEDNQIPSSMGGTSKAKFQLIPSKTRSALEFSELSKGTASKLKKHVESKTDPAEYEEVPSLRVIR
jgi:hypothetical protein